MSADIDTISLLVRAHHKRSDSSKPVLSTRNAHQRIFYQETMVSSIHNVYRI